MDFEILFYFCSFLRFFFSFSSIESTQICFSYGPEGLIRKKEISKVYFEVIQIPDFFFFFPEN